MWALASPVGPLLGGFFVEYLHWAWIFWINLPLAPLAVAGVYWFLREPDTRRQHSVDYAGAALLASGVSLMLFGLLQGGVAWPWLSPPSLSLLCGALILLIGFVLRQRSAPEPMSWMSGSPRDRPSAASSAIVASCVKPTTRKLLAWTFSMAAVSAVSAAS